MLNREQMIEVIENKIADWELVQSNDYNFIRDTDMKNIKYNCTICKEEKKQWHKCERMIYKKISLARVLNALGEDYYFIIDTWIWEVFVSKDVNICPRNLCNEDWSDCMLDSQSEKTIEALYNIICK